MEKPDQLTKNIYDILYELKMYPVHQMWEAAHKIRAIINYDGPVNEGELPKFSDLRNADGIPDELWISAEAIALTLEDCRQGEGYCFVRKKAAPEIQRFTAPLIPKEKI